MIQTVSKEGYDVQVEAQVAAAVSAGETLADMASYWEAATSEERRDDGGLWRRGLAQLPKQERVKNVPPPTPPALTPEQQASALKLAQAGLSLRKVATHFPGVSYGAIWRLLRTRGHAE